MRILPILCLALALGACSKGDKQTVAFPPSWSVESLTYAYPYNGQAMIAPTAPIVLHFSAALTETDETALASRFSLTQVDSGSAVPFSAALVDGGQGVVLTPNELLAEKSEYELSWSGLSIVGGEVRPVPLRFSTRPANKGPNDLVKEGGSFTVARRIPTQAEFPLMDFSSLRLQFTQPIDSKTATYGSAVRLEAADGSLVPARLLVSGRLLTVDPVQDLTPGANYSLKLLSTLKSSFGDSLVPGPYADFDFTPKDSKPRAMTALTVPATGALSNLTGKPINNVPIQSKLLGNDSASQQSGNLFAELAFVPNFPNATPLRVARGNLLSGESVNVQIVGRVPAGLDTGAISVNIISDANGYMVANPYSREVDAPRQVYLTMDVAMSAANPESNGAFTQNILHVEVVGTAIVKNAQLTMDAVGVVELEVLGLDQAAGVLSFHLEGIQNLADVPAPTLDILAPLLQSWTPGAESGRTRAGDPISLTFTETMDAASFDGAITLLKDGVSAPFSWRQDGASVVITPDSPLAHNSAYRVQVAATATDLAGNPLAAPLDLSFNLADLSAAAPRSPIALTSYPGFPCATTGRNIASNQQGRCVGGKNTDDLLPLPSLPADRDIKVVFSQNIAPASVRLGASCGAAASFKVELVDSSGACTGVVAGRLSVEPQLLRFTPDQPWSNGQLYRYVLGSNGDHRLATASCDGSQALCGTNGLPLQTRLFGQQLNQAPTPNGGGPNIEIVFQGEPRSSTVFQTLRALPTSDVNANFIHEDSEAGPSGDPLRVINGNIVTTRNPSGGGSVSEVNIGCPVGQSCPEKKFVYLSSALDAEVADFDEALGGVKVLIRPTLLVLSSFDAYAEVSLPLVTPNNPVKSGPLALRLRHALDNPANTSGPRTQPIIGLIKEGPDGKPVLSAELEAYLDTAELNPTVQSLGLTVPLTHDVRSRPLLIQVSGPVSFLPDGRMLATLSNLNDIDVDIEVVALGLLTGNIFLTIPSGSLIMEGVSGAIKK